MAWSVVAACVASGLVALALGSLSAGSGSDTWRTAALAGATSAIAAAMGASFVRLGAGAGAAPSGVLVLCGSLLRGVSLVAVGLAVQYALGPAPVVFWSALLGGWLAAKAVEIRVVWARLGVGVGTRSAPEAAGKAGTV